MPADIKFVVAVQNWFARCGGCKIIDFYKGSYQDDIKYIFWWPTLIIHSCFLCRGCFIDIN